MKKKILWIKGLSLIGLNDRVTDKSSSTILKSILHNHFSRKGNLLSVFAFTFLMIWAGINTRAQSPGFAKEYFIDSTYNWPFEIIQTGSYYFVCGSSSHSNTADLGFLIKVDSAGNEVWQQSYPNTTILWAMEEVNDLLYLQDGWNRVIKIDGEGNETWSATNTLPVTYDLTMIPTGSFFQTGTAIDAANYSRFGFIKLNNDGSLALEQWIDSSSYGYGTSLRHDGDKLIYGCGAGVPEPMFSDSSFTVAFVADTNGTMIWNKRFDSLNNYVASEMLRTVDGGFIFYGSMSEPGTPVSLMKTDYNGNFDWIKNYSNLTWTTPHVLVADSTSIAFLVMNGSFFPEDSVVLIKTNLTGDILFTRSFSGTGGSLIETSDHGYLIGLMKGYAINNNNYSNLMLIKTDSNGEVITSVEIPVLLSGEIKVYPNPAAKSLTVELKHATLPKEIALVDVFGRVVQQSFVKNKIMLDISSLSAGVYFLKVLNEKGMVEEVKTVVIQ